MATQRSELDASPTGRRSEGIDFLRGWFSLQVLVFAHIIFWAAGVQGQEAVPNWVTQIGLGLIWFFQGHGELNPAVIGFIVLSGYCIHKNGLGRGSSSLESFTIRRSLRILPVFIVSTVAGIILFQVSVGIDAPTAMNLTGTKEIDTACVVAKLTAVASLWPIAHRCDYLGNAPLLTVMVEIGLYVAYGLIFWLDRKWIVYTTATVSVVVGVLIAINNSANPNLYNWWQNSSLLAFFPYWWIGAASVSPAVRREIIRWTPAIMGTWIALTFLSQQFDSAAVAEIRKLALSLIVARIVIWSDRIAMPSNPFSWLGRASYSIYGLHAPIAITLILAGFSWWQSAAVAVAVGAIAYVVVERPLDYVGRRLSKSKVTMMAVSGRKPEPEEYTEHEVKP